MPGNSATYLVPTGVDTSPRPPTEGHRIQMPNTSPPLPARSTSYRGFDLRKDFCVANRLPPWQFNSSRPSFEPVNMFGTISTERSENNLPPDSATLLPTQACPDTADVVATSHGSVHARFVYSCELRCHLRKSTPEWDEFEFQNLLLHIAVLSSAAVPGNYCFYRILAPSASRGVMFF